MTDKYLETVEVKTYLQRVRCFNKSCKGALESDGKDRTENGVHGGRIEYRHICDKCGVGAWLKGKYPKVTYELVTEMTEIEEETELED